MLNLRNWATPITVGSFIISAISGVILFFHLNIGMMKPAHEWLSWFMILGVALHVFTNWHSFKQYFKKPIPLAVISVFVILTALSFFTVGQDDKEGGRKNFRATANQSMQLLQSTPVYLIAQIAKTTPEAMIERLTSQGMKVENAAQNLVEIAGSNNRNVRELLMIVTEK